MFQLFPKLYTIVLGPSAIPITITNLSQLQPTFFGLLLAGGLVGLPLLTATLIFSDRIPPRPALFLMYRVAKLTLIVKGSLQ